MNIKDLEFGNVVKLRNGTLCLIHPVRGSNHRNLFWYLNLMPRDTVFLRDIETGGFICDFTHYDNDLNIDNEFCRMKYEILEVYKDYTLQELLWKRGEEDEDEH